jgi:hypothetical protein
VRDDVNDGINTRDKLSRHDPALALLLHRTYGDGDWRFTDALSPECREAWRRRHARRPRARGSRCWLRVREAALCSGACDLLPELSPPPASAPPASAPPASAPPAASSPAATHPQATAALAPRAGDLMDVEDERLLALAIEESLQSDGALAVQDGGTPATQPPAGEPEPVD